MVQAGESGERRSSGTREPLYQEQQNLNLGPGICKRLVRAIGIQGELTHDPASDDDHAV